MLRCQDAAEQDWDANICSQAHFTDVCLPGVAVTLGVMRAAEVGKATAEFFSGLLGGSKSSGKKSSKL